MPTESNEPCTSCREFERRLADSERRPHVAGALAPSLADLAGHVRACGRCRAKHGARLTALEGFSALRGRAVPDGVLDGLGERVLERARLGGSLGGGMSAAFLDAPRSLALWRRTAVAAGVLVAVGAGLLATGEVGWRDGRRAPAGDGTVPIRDGTLEAWETHRADDPVPSRLQMVGLPVRGLPGYWSPSAGSSDHVWIHPVPPPSEAAATGK